MPHIALNPALPGIVALFEAYPDSEKYLNQLAQHLLRSDSDHGPSSAERELIAAYVSRVNNCQFCSAAHGAVAEKLAKDPEVVEQAICDLESADLSAKMKALLNIARKTALDATSVSADDIDAARKAGAQDKDIHDTVLIAAAFCMFNRYVDGLGTTCPDDPAYYGSIAERLIARGYGMGDPEGERK